MRLVHDPDRCTGHGRCYALVPELFEDDECGHGLLRGDGNLTEADLAAARRAVDACPERAISIVES